MAIRHLLPLVPAKAGTQSLDSRLRGNERHTSRRDVLKATGTLAVLGVISVSPAHTTPAEMQAAIAKVVGEGRLSPGRVKLDIPPLVENGNTVPCTVSVESPMTQTDYVKAIHIFTEKNPQPNVIGVELGPRAGKATVSTRIRLADTQTVTAVAQLSDGSFWSHQVNVIITLGACLEEF